jgi:two-component system response regulator TctD
MHPPRLLLVDDEDTILFAMREYFTASGFRVDCAGEREEAEALLASREYSAVIADLRLTGSDSGDGLNVIAAAREKSRRLRVVLLSAHASPQVEARARAAGADAVLRKPRPLREIAACLHALECGN